MRRAIEENWPDTPRDDLDAVEACVTEFDEWDPQSFSFRYPVDRKGDLSLPGHLEQIDLHHLAEVMERLASLLSGSMDGLDHFLEIKREMEAWYCPPGPDEPYGYY